MTALRRVSAILCCTWLAACGEGGEETPREAQREGVFDPLTQTLERAEGVEDTLRERSEALRRRVEEDTE